MHLLEEGGPFFMYTLMVILFISIGLFIYGLLKKDKQLKAKDLLGSVGLFALVFGFLGQVIGLIGAFDAIESLGDVSPGVLAAGLKLSFLSTGFGALVFLVARFGIIVLTAIKKP
jgi:biopolymer transport protein ExbB/TolQ